ncbi:capsule biosynthesis protein [Sphingorhabdus sp.]|uniref:capsule biosynthesis protein n=1 Tax=Sphingorhabdus sp. TaxID=1902408 RepID=UPI0040476D62
MTGLAPINVSAKRREFLFLQGPPGAFFRLLANRLAERGAGVRRINFSGGDRHDWTGDCVNYRGLMSRWPMFFDRMMLDWGITDIVLFGDCRPVHQTAIRMAQLRGIHVHVFEEGYIRPDWMTLERDGVNGHSPITRDPGVILAAAATLPPVPDLPTITADFRRRARDSYWHYHHVFFGKLGFPFYRTHRQGSLFLDAFGWLLKFASKAGREAQVKQTLKCIEGRDFFLFPLQLTGDYQIRAHSPFRSMLVGMEYVLESFARHASQNASLLIKEHPLDSGYMNWRSKIMAQARRLGVEDRVFHIGGGDLEALAEASLGMVCVNSTSGTLALASGKPVVVLGDAVYDVPGVTHQRGLDKFWLQPEVPDARLYDAFKRMLHAHCLVRGGLAGKSGVETLVENSAERLLAEFSTHATELHRPARRRSSLTRAA